MIERGTRWPFVFAYLLGCVVALGVVCWGDQGPILNHPGANFQGVIVPQQPTTATDQPFRLSGVHPVQPADANIPSMVAPEDKSVNAPSGIAAAIIPDPKTSDLMTPAVSDQREFSNLYHLAAFPKVSTGTAQNFTIVNGSFSTTGTSSATFITAAGSQLNFTTGTINSFMVVGTATNDNAPAGRIGEYVESVVSTGQNSAAGTFTNLTSISLTPGDWDISLDLGELRNASSWTDSEWGISTTSADSGMAIGANCRGDYIGFNNGAANITAVIFTIPSCRFTFTANATVFAPVIINAGAGTPQVRGKLTARRIR